MVVEWAIVIVIRFYSDYNLNNVLLVNINLIIMALNLSWLLFLYILRRPLEFDEIFKILLLI